MEVECYCLVADVLGFSSLVRNLDEGNRAERVGSWLTLVASSLRDHGLTRSSIISDTIFVGSDFSEEGLEQLVSFSRAILEAGMNSSLPVRGAISFGPVAWEETLTYGPPIVTAYEFANQQNWSGISGTAERLPHADRLLDVGGGLVTYATPLKSGLVAYHPVVRWSIPRFEELISLMSTHGLARNGDMMEWAFANKVQNTFMFRAYLDGLPTQWDASRFYGGILPLQSVASVRGVL